VIKDNCQQTVQQSSISNSEIIIVKGANSQSRSKTYQSTNDLIYSDNELPNLQDDDDSVPRRSRLFEPGVDNNDKRSRSSDSKKTTKSNVTTQRSIINSPVRKQIPSDGFGAFSYNEVQQARIAK
jgi:hypothetical protein